jgi:hypothetical protein
MLKPVIKPNPIAARRTGMMIVFGFMIPPLECPFNSALNACKKDANLPEKIGFINIAEPAFFASKGSGQWLRNRARFLPARKTGSIRRSLFSPSGRETMPAHSSYGFL